MITYQFNVKKTKAPVLRGEIMRKWGTRYKKATAKDRTPFYVVVDLIDEDTISVVSY